MKVIDEKETREEYREDKTEPPVFEFEGKVTFLRLALQKRVLEPD